MKQAFKILDGLHRSYVPFLAAFLLDKRASTTLSMSLRMATNADKHCSGDCRCQNSGSYASASLKFAAGCAMIFDLRVAALSLIPIGFLSVKAYASFLQYRNYVLELLTETAAAERVYLCKEAISTCRVEPRCSWSLQLSLSPLIKP
jgi:hypothetical protein